MEIHYIKNEDAVVNVLIKQNNVVEPLVQKARW